MGTLLDPLKKWKRGNIIHHHGSGAGELHAGLLRFLLDPPLLQLRGLVPVVQLQDGGQEGVQPQRTAVRRLLRPLLVRQVRLVPGGEGAQAEGGHAYKPVVEASPGGSATGRGPAGAATDAGPSRRSARLA